MIRIYNDDFVPKYVNGHWGWNAEKDCLQFDSHTKDTREGGNEIIVTCGFKFLASLNQVEELIFRQEFQRPPTTYDADVILLQDIRNLATYLAPPEIVNEEFCEFVNTKTMHTFLKALIIYFDYFLKVVEFILIRRDEIHGDKAQIQSTESNELKRVYSANLAQYRLLLAREYSNIVLGMNDVKKFHHIAPIINISWSIKDRAFHETILAFSTQVVWITLHRQDFTLIDMEMNRLFRSEHFKLSHSDRVKFTDAEARLLYGKNSRRCNYRSQNSPLIQELNNVEKRNRPILWIGRRKYQGNDVRILEIELQFIVNAAQMSLANISLGILGHPKCIYNTLLKLDWEAVRQYKFSETYDPYGIIKQPYLTIPSRNQEELRKLSKTYESFYELQSQIEYWTPERTRKFSRLHSIVEYFKTEGILTDVWIRCTREVEDTTYLGVEEIMKSFNEQKEKLRKKKH
uniref:Uncharacterized protein n=1 Tax=Glossina brevipalpis TaxID=37001 RepID=A0A1A9W7T9_9MUSC